jgi:RNA polymerase sigma factor (sigma-70 family)
MMDDHIEVIERCIDRMNAGDPDARDGLLNCACARLRAVVEKRMKDFARLARREPPEDVAQDAALKLWIALKDISPSTAGEFWLMAGEEVRRVLLDLTRHHFGPRHRAVYTEIPRPSSAAPAERRDPDFDAANLDRWTALHAQIADLPEDERNVAMLVWYSGLTVIAAGRALGISRNTAQRRWKAARTLLSDALKGERPDG